MTIEDKLIKIVGHVAHKDWFIELEQLVNNEVSQAVKERDEEWREAVGKMDDAFERICDNPFLHRIDIEGKKVPKSIDIEMSVQKAVTVRNELKKEILTKMKAK